MELFVVSLSVDVYSSTVKIRGLDGLPCHGHWANCMPLDSIVLVHLRISDGGYAVAASSHRRVRTQSVEYELIPLASH